MSAGAAPGRARQLHQAAGHERGGGGGVRAHVLGARGEQRAYLGKQATPRLLLAHACARRELWKWMALGREQCTPTLAAHTSTHSEPRLRACACVRVRACAQVDVEYGLGHVETVELLPGKGAVEVTAADAPLYVEAYTKVRRPRACVGGGAPPCAGRGQLRSLAGSCCQGEQTLPFACLAPDCLLPRSTCCKARWRSSWPPSAAASSSSARAPRSSGSGAPRTHAPPRRGWEGSMRARRRLRLATWSFTSWDRGT